MSFLPLHNSPLGAWKAPENNGNGKFVTLFTNTSVLSELQS